MTFRLELTPTAQAEKDRLEKDDEPKFKKIVKTLYYLEADLRPAGMHTHEFKSLKGANGEKMWTSYVENKTPAAFRILWYHDSKRRGVIMIQAITPHY